MNDYESGRTLFMPDTRFITEFDQYLFGQGTHYDLYNKLGAHPMTVDGDLQEIRSPSDDTEA